MTRSKEIKILIDGVIASASAYSQGGSIRIILPKKVVRALKIGKYSRSEAGEGMDINTSSEDEDEIDLVFILSNKGLILRPLQDFLADRDMNDS